MHEIDEKSRFWSTVVTCDQWIPFQVRIPPSLSIAAQKRLSGQLTPTRLPPIFNATTGADQLEPLYLTACPLESRAVHDVMDGQDTEANGA